MRQRPSDGDQITKPIAEEARADIAQHQREQYAALALRRRVQIEGFGVG
jgi:hypothetical protein